MTGFVCDLDHDALPFRYCATKGCTWTDAATPPLVAALPVPPVVPDSEALDLGRCFCRHLELTCTGPDGHPNKHAAWNGHGNLIAWACYCHSSTSPHMDPEAGIANV